MIHATSIGSATVGMAVYLNPHAKPASSPLTTAHRTADAPGRRTARTTHANDSIAIASMPFSTYAMPHSHVRNGHVATTTPATTPGSRPNSRPASHAPATASTASNTLT